MQLEFVITLRNLTHSDFNTKYYFPMFLKAAWQAYNSDNFTKLSSSQFQIKIIPLFEILFLSSDNDLDSAVLTLKDMFANVDDVERFLNNTFYIILNLYVKSFYKHGYGWDKIGSFVNAAEDCISYIGDIFGLDATTDIFNQDLINIFTKISNNQQNITVYNTYYGVPIESKAQIIEIGAESILIKAPRNQLAAAKHSGEIYILKNKDVDYDIYAKAVIKYINKERFLKLTHFHWMKKPFFKRKNIRVHPLKSVRIDAISDGEMVALNLYDISLGGAATTGQNPSLSNHKVITLYFPSEILSDFKMVDGALVEDSNVKEGKVYHFEFNLTKQQETFLSQYIADQERRIVQMLRQEPL